MVYSPRKPTTITFKSAILFLGVSCCSGFNDHFANTITIFQLFRLVESIFMLYAAHKITKILSTEVYITYLPLESEFCNAMAISLII